jgi:hypothetical protein
MDRLGPWKRVKAPLEIQLLQLEYQGWQLPPQQQYLEILQQGRNFTSKNEWPQRDNYWTSSIHVPIDKNPKFKFHITSITTGLVIWLKSIG